MMTKILLFSLTLFTLSNAQSTQDQDMDGVPDTIDQCLNTPFLDEVNDKGCSISTLIFPYERDNGSLDVSLGYGYSIDEELLDRNSQHTTKFQISYYLNDWSYSLRTGYFRTNDDTGMQDTTLKIKHKFKITKSLKVGLGLGVRLPTYDFTGNNTDYTLYGSIVYYPKSALSVFAGVSHTFIKDDEIVTPLQDINTLYAGSGYFFSKNFYANIAYTYSESKFTTNDPAHSIISTVLYKINKKWFTTFSYSHQIQDDLSNSASIKFGYSVW